MYDISILSNIPSTVAKHIPLEPLPTRLQPLFSIGVHDIDSLSRRDVPTTTQDSEPNHGPENGWIACTTDHVLGMKNNLYDVLVKLPALHSAKPAEKKWPTLQTSKGAEIKATQRDLRRYRTLRQGLVRQRLRKVPTTPFAPRQDNEQDEGESEDDAVLLRANTQETLDDASSTIDAKLAEPMSWPAMAYSSFMWWASAGERGADLEEEIQHDCAMLPDFGAYSDTPTEPQPQGQGGPGAEPPMMTDGSPTAPEMSIIAYFHHLTATMLSVLASLVENDDAVDNGHDQQGENEDEKSAIFVGSEDMVRMGLDMWSEADRHFVEELVDLYWGRKADVQGGRIDCCGVRIY